MINDVLYLDEEPGACAVAHADVHVRCMIQRVGYVLSCILQRAGMEDASLYMDSGERHLWVDWGRASRGNYLWLLSLLVHLIAESDYRFTPTVRGKVKWERARHVAAACLDMCSAIPAGSMTSVPMSFGVHEVTGLLDRHRSEYAHRVLDSGVDAEWTRRERPEWLEEVS